MSEHEIELLKAEVARLRTQVDASAKEIATLHLLCKRLNDSLTKCVHGLGEVIGDALERIKLLEVKVFPGLVRDLSAMHKIVPFSDDTPGDALDKRKP